MEEWTKRFRAIGLDDAAMTRWHQPFERENPAEHASFLERLGLPADRIDEVRRWDVEESPAERARPSPGKGAGKRRGQSLPRRLRSRSPHPR